MLPLRDTAPSHNYPLVNNILIGINLMVFIFQLTQGDQLNRFFYTNGLVPARYIDPEISYYFSTSRQLLSFLTFMFLHGGIWHLLLNMWTLYIFGTNVEDALGHFRYLAFYLLCGVASGLSHFVFNIHSTLPTVGASGAIAGVMGAYLMLYPDSRILTLIPILFIPYFIEIPAYFFLGAWLVIQFIKAASGHGEGIAWWAHIGGFVFGIIFLKLFHSLPGTGISDKVQRVTQKKRSHHLQMIHTYSSPDDPDIYGQITVTRLEAARGVRKLVNIPWGFYQRLYNVTIPRNTRDGSTLRLRGMGKLAGNGQRGDLLLRVKFETQEIETSGPA